MTSSVAATVDVDGLLRDYGADAVLVAAGRTPLTADLNLAAAGGEVDGRCGVVVDDRLGTTTPGSTRLATFTQANNLRTCRSTTIASSPTYS